MAEAKTEQEPSIEEILESIRQIISEDGDAPAAPGGAVANDPARQDPQDKSSLTLRGEEALAEDEIILELTEVAEPEDKGADLDLTPAEEDNWKGDTTLMANNQEIQDKAVEIDLAPAAEPKDNGGDVALLSKTASDAASAEISKLLSTNIAIEREDATRIGSVTLEDMARDLMRPLIKSWLDQNLPKLIEKAVAKEIEKLSRRASGE